MNNKKIVIILILMSISLVGCTKIKNRELENTVDEFFESIKEQDLDKLSLFMPNSELKNIIRDNSEFIKCFTDRFEWKIKTIDEVDGKYVANIIIRTVCLEDTANINNDKIVKLINSGQLDDKGKKEINLSLSFKKTNDEYVLIYDEYTYLDIIDSIIGRDI